MKSIALVTYSGRSELSLSDQTLLNPLYKRGITPVPTVWDDLSVDWSQFDSVVLRSCWDYYKKANLFRQWLTKLQDLNVPMYNAQKAVLWNMEKTYLRDLAEHDVKIIPTVWANNKIDLHQVLEESQWQQAVLKPVMGASGYGIQHISASNPQENQLLIDAMLKEGTVMIQPIIEEIQYGELSLIFFQDQFQYAIRKMPGKGTIFVNSAHGGTYMKTDIDDQIVVVAKSVLTVACKLTNQESFLYARVDGVMVDNQFVLMELELIEPGLFLDVAVPNASEAFASAISECI